MELNTENLVIEREREKRGAIPAIDKMRKTQVGISSLLS